jgi:6-pyruvoyltetrahydropterin/6-carboxytetrahydropterin synthase
MKREVAIEIDFCYGHRLLGYTGKCSHYHGHNAKIEVAVSSKQLDQLGFVIDFSLLKSELKNWINENWDHHMILNQEDPVIKSIQQVDPWVTAINTNPTAEWMVATLATYIKYTLLPKLEQQIFADPNRRYTIELEYVKIWETPTSFATIYGEEVRG